MRAIDILLHFDKFLVVLSHDLGVYIYVVLFLVVFAETGLVVTPFLPGDSLLFALGAMTTISDANLNFAVLSVLLFCAALSGDNVNYFVGSRLGPRIFSQQKSRFFKHEHLVRAQEFYARFGARAVIIARFIPIVRTFVPFVAGIGTMKYSRFLSFSVFGAVLWIQIFLWAGRIFGNIPSVQANFHYVIIGVIILSVIPILFNLAKGARNATR